MGKAATNISSVLGLIIIAFGGYWFYTNSESSSLESSTTTEQKEAMLRDTAQFAEYSKTLNEIKLDMSIFEDQRFRNLKSYTTEIQKSEVGRENPFAEAKVLVKSTP